MPTKAEKLVKEREQATISNMNLSRSLQCDLKWSLLDGAVKEMNAQTQAAKVVAQLKRNMAETEPHFQASQQMIAVIEECVPKVNQCLIDTRHFHLSLGSNALDVCERRLELRGKRPFDEKIEDQFQLDLKIEKEIILQGRKELALLVNKVVHWQSALEACKRYLVEDLGHKRQAFRMAQVSMHECRHKEHSLVSRPRSAGRPNSARYRRQNDPAVASVFLQERFDVDVEQMMQTVRSVESEALNSCQECAQKRLQILDDVEAATAKTEESMRSSILRLSQLKSALSQQIVETKEAIKSAEVVLKRASFKQDVSSDPEHMKWQGAVDAIDDLKWSEEQLRSDLKLKILALRMDEMCSKVVAGAAPRRPTRRRPQSARAAPKEKPPFLPSGAAPKQVAPTELPQKEQSK